MLAQLFEILWFANSCLIWAVTRFVNVSLGESKGVSSGYKSSEKCIFLKKCLKQGMEDRNKGNGLQALMCCELGKYDDKSRSSKIRNLFWSMEEIVNMMYVYLIQQSNGCKLFFSVTRKRELDRLPFKSASWKQKI